MIVKERGPSWGWDRDDPQPDVVVVRLDSPSFGGLQGRLSEYGHEHPLLALSAALAASPPARTMPGVVLAVQEQPVPSLLFIGRIDTAARARISELSGLVEEAGVRLRILGWEDVEAAAQRLAERLREHLGDEVIDGACLVGIPRGGAIVTGLLAYALDIPRTRVGWSDEADTVILVDDCSITGVRLREVLASYDTSQRLVIATLLSHPDLRAAVVAAEPQVSGFVSGEDLREHTDQILGARSGDWRRRWKERVPTRYHTALLDLPVFPWGEPQVRLYNPVTEQIEANWWLAPPSSCLHHRVAPTGLQVQHVDADPARPLLAAGVAPVSFDGATILIDTEGGSSLRLSGTAAELWDAWVHADSLEAAVDVICRQYEIDPERVASDLTALLEDLDDRGLLADSPPLTW